MRSTSACSTPPQMADPDAPVVSGQYKDDGEALIGLARQLADAFEEAQTPDDQAYAAEAIDDFLSEHDHYAPDEALIALLDLPMTKLTWPLVDSAEATLAERGMPAVWPLLEAIDGRVYDHGGHTPARALETLGAMREGDVIRGLVNVLAAAADDDLKAAAVKVLVRTGEPAVPVLEDALQDPAARRWAEDSLGDIRAAREERGE
jgi:HEAT repeat protein